MKEEKIKQIVEMTNFSDDDKVIFSNILNSFTDELLIFLYNLIKKDNNYAKFLLDNYYAKKDIIASGDEKRMEELLDKERRFIEKIAEKIENKK